jgi:hypothetical protein
MVKLRTMAYCENCQKRRKFSVLVVSFKTFFPDSGDAVYLDDVADCEIRCKVCGFEVSVSLLQEEIDRLRDVAFDA